MQATKDRNPTGPEIGDHASAPMGFPGDVAVPPPFKSSTLQLSKKAMEADRRAEVVAVSSTLHAAEGAVFRHGETLGMVAVARNGRGEVVEATGVQFEINVTGAGDAQTGTVYDLENGTALIYSTIFFSPSISSSQGAFVHVRINGTYVKGSPLFIPFDMTLHAEHYHRRVAAAREYSAPADTMQLPY